MDGNTLFVSFFFGLVGMGMLSYGKRMGNLVALAAGVGLVVVPYVSPGLGWTCAGCGLLTALPFAVRG